MLRAPFAKSPHFTAKPRVESRPPHGMSRSAAVLLLAALVTPASCFQYAPKDCQVLCVVGNAACPGSMECLAQAGLNRGIGLCATHDTVCPPLSDSGVIPTDSGAQDASDAGSSQPPTMLCHNSTCFTLPDSIRSNLVLLLWPSNLPPAGSTVPLWADQSGKANDAHALDPGAMPTVIPDGVHVDSSRLGTGFVVPDSPSLDFGSGDFALIGVAGISSAMTPTSIVRKSDGARANSRQISIDFALSGSSTALTLQLQGVINDTTIPAVGVHQPSVAAYTLSRSADHVELHRNGTVFGSADLPAGISTTNTASLYVGVGGPVGSSTDSLEAVIAVRGPVDSIVLNQLESFLYTVFGSAGP
jgi:hypothetical protein